MTARERSERPSPEEAEALVVQQLELDTQPRNIVRYMHALGFSEEEAKELVTSARRRRRRDIVDQMVTAMVEGADEQETFERFRGCGESEVWLRKAVARAAEQVEEVDDPTAFRRANLIGLGIFRIVGGLAATIISATLSGTTAAVYWGAIVAGIASLSAGLAMGRGSSS
jgi:hypothetical protein